jgi:hypothetical protein
MIWAATARQWVPDTDVGAAIILIPFGVLVVAGAYLIGMYRIKRQRE